MSDEHQSGSSSPADFGVSTKPIHIVEGSLKFHGRAPEIIGLVLKNLLLNILTIGFYRFWARTKVRRYIWQKMYVLGSPLEYTGTGKELFLGFLLIVFVIFLPYAVISGVLRATGFFDNVQTEFWFTIGTYIAIYYLIGVAAYRAQRYRLTRTRWRSIRAGLTGSSWKYGLWSFLYNLLKLVFGLITPWQNMHLWRIEMQNTHIGDKFFVFDKNKKSRDVLKSMYKAWLVPGLTTLLLFYGPFIYLAFELGSQLDFNAINDEDFNSKVGLYFQEYGTVLTAWPFYLTAALVVIILTDAWYQLKQTRLLLSLTTFENIELSFDAKLISAIKLIAGNLMIGVLTLGLVIPFTQIRNARFMARHIHIDGQLNLATIAQSLSDDLTSGEGLAEAFDMGLV